MDALNSIIIDYNKAIVSAHPRDFHADLPILTALGANSYDQLDNIEKLQINLEEGLKKFVKDWKTIDMEKINYLMKYGIVQEIMKVEGRKAIRIEMANRPQPVTEDDLDASSFKSPTSHGRKNSDIANVNRSDMRGRTVKQAPKTFLDAVPVAESKGGNYGRARSGMHDSILTGDSKSPGKPAKEFNPLGSAMKDKTTASVSVIEPKKK